MMRISKWIFPLLLCSTCLGATNSICAQDSARLTIILKNMPASGAGDSVFMAGDFNGWAPHHSHYLVNRINGVNVFSIQLAVQKNYEFKFTRGSWERVEVDATGRDVQNRKMFLYNDTTITCEISAWKDLQKGTAPVHTVIGKLVPPVEGFYSKELHRNKYFSVLLPKGYEHATKRYPVIYMHDGQNLFDAYNNFFGEWGVDEAIDSLHKCKGLESIVVAIHNDEFRMNDYSPYLFDRINETKGDEYVQFIAGTLKPYIDKTYRTLTKKENTTIAGSSLGGLISYYALLTYPDVFGNAGIFSPSFWIDMPALQELTFKNAAQLSGKIFFYIGEAEGEKYVQQMNVIADQLGEQSKAILYSVIDKKGEHNEAYWCKWFPDFFAWIMSDGLNSPIRVNEN